MEEHDAELCASVLRIGDESAIHVGVPARLEDQQLTNVVEVFEGVTTLLHNGGAAQRGHATADDAKRFAGGVVIDGADHQLTAGRGCAHRLILPEPAVPPPLPSDEDATDEGPPRRMKSLKWPGLIVACALLMAGTVMVFMVFDRDSNSASDTIRPFVITMAPVWAVAIAAAIVLLRPPAK
jgi:hypothetical protein